LLKINYLKNLKKIFKKNERIKLIINILINGKYTLSDFDSYFKSPKRFPNHENLSFKYGKHNPIIRKKIPIDIKLLLISKITLRLYLPSI